MAVSKLNPVSGGKTRFITTLTSGTSYTVPAGVTYLNVTLRGGGGGGGGGNAKDGAKGCGGQIVSSTLSATAGASIAYAIGAGGTAGSNVPTSGGNGGTTTFTGATSAAGGNGGGNGNGSAGVVGTASLSAENGGTGGIGSAQGNTGGAGSIDVEYWVQEITMRTFAVIENNKVVNIIVGVEPEVVAANPNKYLDYTDGWDYNNGIDGGDFFPAPVTE